MPAEKPVSATAAPASPARVIRGSATPSMGSVEARLASAEHELRVQFTRIAQIQAELDLVLAALRRATRRAHPRVSRAVAL